MFAPAQGELSRREVVYQAIRDKPSEDLIPYGSMPFPREVMRTLRDSVAKTFEREQQRTVVCVPDEGWKIVRGTAQVHQATRRRRQATKRLGRALQIIKTTDRREMSAEDRKRADEELIRSEAGYRSLRSQAAKKYSIADVKQWQQAHSNGSGQ